MIHELFCDDLLQLDLEGLLTHFKQVRPRTFTPHKDTQTLTLLQTHTCTLLVAVNVGGRMERRLLHSTLVLLLLSV